MPTRLAAGRALSTNHAVRMRRTSELRLVRARLLPLSQEDIGEFDDVAEAGRERGEHPSHDGAEGRDEVQHERQNSEENREPDRTREQDETDHPARER